MNGMNIHNEKWIRVLDYSIGKNVTKVTKVVTNEN